MLNGRRLFVYGKTKAEASEKLSKYREMAKKTGGMVSPANVTLAEFTESWLDSLRQTLRPTTIAVYEVLLRRHILPYLGSQKIGKITPFGLSVHFSELAKTVGVSALAKTRRTLSKLMDDAVSWQVIPANPVLGVPAPKEIFKEKVVWSIEETRTFLAGIADGRCGIYGNLFSFLLGSGARVGEALALRPSDFDLAARTVRIERSLSFVGGKWIELPPKTKAGVRTVTLPTWTVEAVRSQIAQNLLLGVGQDRVFVTSNGTTPPKRNLLRALYAACDRLGVRRLSVHSLRHMNASLLALNGVPVKVAQARLGHASVSVTLGIYAHVLGHEDQEAADTLDRYAHTLGSTDDNGD